MRRVSRRMVVVSASQTVEWSVPEGSVSASQSDVMLSPHLACFLRDKVGRFSGLDRTVRLVKDAAEIETLLRDDVLRDRCHVLVRESLCEAAEVLRDQLGRQTAETRRKTTHALAMEGNPTKAETRETSRRRTQDARTFILLADSIWLASLTPRAFRAEYWTGL